MTGEKSRVREVVRTCRWCGKRITFRKRKWYVGQQWKCPNGERDMGGGVRGHSPREGTER